MHDLNATKQPGREIDAVQMQQDVQNDFEQVMEMHSTAKVSKKRMKSLIGEIVKGISESYKKQISDLHARSSAESEKKAPLVAKREEVMIWLQSLHLH